MTPPRWKRAVKRAALAAALLAGTAAAGDVGYRYWTTGRYLQSTDDAYVAADYHHHRAESLRLYLGSSGGRQRAGESGPDPGADRRPRFRRAARSGARRCAAAEAAIRNLDAQISLQQAEIGQAIAVVAATRASLGFARSDAERYRELVRTGAGTVQRAEQTQAVRDQLDRAVAA